MLTFQTKIYIIYFALVEVIVLKWNLQWILKQKDYTYDFEDDLKFQSEAFEQVSNLIDVETVHVTGRGRFIPKENRLYVDLKITGTMIVPDAYTNEEVPYPFETSSTEIFSFVKPSPDEDDVHEARKGVVDLTPIIFQNIIVEVPLRVVKENSNVKTSGDGWSIIQSKDEYKKNDDYIDPRLAKLTEFFKDKN